MKSKLTLWTLGLLASSSPFAVHAVDFKKDIQPILEAQCVSCHNPEKDKGSLMLHDVTSLLKGGDSGHSIVSGKADESLLLQRVLLPEDDDEHMPPKGILSEDEKSKLRAWINAGAAWPQGLVLKAKTQEELASEKRVLAKLSKIKSLEIYPPSINLETKRDFSNFQIFAKFEDDTTADVTAWAKIELKNPALAKFEDSKWVPVADGQSEITAQVGSKTASIPFAVSKVGQDRPISFNLDVMPVFLKANCNGGACHGSARGKDGFHLSLFGYDPDNDYINITRQFSGRRINLGVPEESTLIEKALGKVPHSGNQCFEEGGLMHQALVEWIEKGVPKDAADVATVTGIELYPKQVVMEGKGQKQPLTVRATYSDGTDRDVTHLVVFSSDNDPTASVDTKGFVTSHEKGEAFVLARFDTYSVVSQFIVIPDSLKYEKPQLVENNYIDTLVNDKLHKLRVIPSGLCTDHEFIRRAHIDINGTLPTPEDVKSFVADTNPKKREALVDKLLDRKEFTEMWVMKWAELLQMRSAPNNTAPYYKNVLLYNSWLAEKIANNVPINEIIFDILASQGGTIASPPANYYQMELDTLKVTENVAQVFLGMRLQCAQCHNHPFDRWTMNDYYGFVAFFTQIGRKPTDDPRETIVFNRKGGESIHPVTKKAVKPKFLGGAEPEMKPGEDRRVALAKWLTSSENQFFANNLVNMTWAHFFGIGIIEPVDDVRVSNPPSNPELLDALGKKMVEYKFDFKKLVRDITTSVAYQRTTKANASNAGDKRNFAKAEVRRMRAEVLADALSSVTNAPLKYQGLPLGARAIQIADGATTNYFLTTFGRATRDTVCSCEVKMEPTLSQALHFLNGEAAHENIKKGKLIEQLVKENRSDADIINELYLKAFGREPTAKEKEILLKQIGESGENRTVVLEDVFWALLNAKEFYFNH